MQIDGFTHGYLAEHPELMDLAREAGVSREVISDIEGGLDATSAVDRRRRSYARFLIAEIEDQDLIPAG